MDLSWFQSLLLGFISGLTDILPVSSQAHKAVLLKVLGVDGEPPLLRLLIHLATLGALYYCSTVQITRMLRQRKLAKIPKKRRKRPLDTRVLMDIRLLTAMAVPAVIGMIGYYKASVLNERLNWIALFLVVNSIVLFLPVLMPSGNKDSRSLSRLEGVLMGSCSCLAALPGVSSIGAVTSIASLCGAERAYIFNITLLLQMVITAGLAVLDVVTLIQVGIGAITFGALLACLLGAVAAFMGVFLGIRLMRLLSVNIGYNGFAFYSLGLAMLTFILFLQV